MRYKTHVDIAESGWMKTGTDFGLGRDKNENDWCPRCYAQRDED